jgi:2-amino-4-hydroxy-6-hydroxymethyldihydropteridine diphosphokinase
MSAAPRQAFVGAGANLGDRAATILAAITILRKSSNISYVESSSLYETDPIGKVDQPLFLNAVIGLETSLGPEDLLTTLLRIERQFGRVRFERWGPRTLDLDLLIYEGETRSSESLSIPHPRFLERNFVTVPLAEVLARPVFQKACWSALQQQLAARRDTTGVRLFSVKT